ncbi:MAG: anaerobic sulfatase-maturation protein [Bacteroidaceae bacterium]|nr:anaerobic sulfatase-maturation protein [Bacteroidaceae bacterium]
MLASPFARPLYVMLKPVGAHCNLACQYCYYLDKQKLYAHEPRHILSEQLLEHFTREYIGAQTTDEVLFTWHGGETMMRPLSFFRRAVELQKKYAGDKHISNCIQTNGTLVTEDWARFLHDEGWLVGVSIDGPQKVHDHYRRTRQDRPTWAKVRHGIDMLNRFQVEWNAMAVVNDINGDDPVGFYRFFRDDLQCRYLQFTPIVEQMPDGTVAPFNVRPRQWGEFLCGVFDEWLQLDDVGNVFVQIFDATLCNWCGVVPGVCTMARSCGHAAVMEWNGDVYSCDHFVFPLYKLGNLHDTPLVEMMYGPQQTQFGRMKQEGLVDECRQCEWLFACNGECPKNRIRPDGRNYLCEGYRMYFEHVAPWMDDMAQQLRRPG